MFLSSKPKKNLLKTPKKVGWVNKLISEQIILLYSTSSFNTPI